MLGGAYFRMIFRLPLYVSIPDRERLPVMDGG
jgi:hypothetical protein